MPWSVNLERAVDPEDEGKDYGKDEGRTISSLIFALIFTLISLTAAAPKYTERVRGCFCNTSMVACSPCRFERFNCRIKVETL